MPVQFFVGKDHEGILLPFSVSATRSETTEDYVWVLQQFYKCFRSIPKCLIVDGDEAIANAINRIADSTGCEITILLCIWHLYKNIVKQLYVKNVKFDELELKKMFYALRGAETRAMFDAKWDIFREKYGTNDDATNYLQNYIYAKRTMWASAWTGPTFTANMTTTGISESLHSMLASGNSASSSLVGVLQKIDGIVISQRQKSDKRASKWAAKQSELELNDVRGLSGASVTRLLSGEGFRLFSSAADQSRFASCMVIDPVDELALQSWAVRELSGTRVVHIVSERPFNQPTPGSDLYRQVRTIETSLGLHMDLGTEACAGCRLADDPSLDQAFGFNLMPNFELLYPGKERLTRVLAALGLGQPKEAGSTNNKTIPGLIEVICAYQAHLKDSLANGMGLDEAKVAARKAMTSYDYHGTQLGYPRFKMGVMIQCGVISDEDSVPNELKRLYCGKWFHLQCAGLLRKPRNESIRIQCMDCLQDRRYRPKTPAIVEISHAATYRSDGRPRIVDNEVTSSIKTMNLTCNCDTPISVGVPCAGMIKVADTVGAVLSHLAYSPHWWAGSLISPVKIKPAFEKNRSKVFAVDEVLQAPVQPRPAHVDEELEVIPAGRVIQDDFYDPAARPYVTMNHQIIDEVELDLQQVQDGHAVSSRKRSRAIKGQNPNPAKKLGKKSGKK